MRMTLACICVVACVATGLALVAIAIHRQALAPALLAYITLPGVIQSARTIAKSAAA